ncbi:hypothetical protein PT974_07517 [Cladobotryum mycophilum]|uniref:Uncharacterized protein n=1 Tax=Cladobotryum mycophilum TaxID=491253 RepID=A0ABR0SPH1_9HYPO
MKEAQEKCAEFEKLLEEAEKQIRALGVKKNMYIERWMHWREQLEKRPEAQGDCKAHVMGELAAAWDKKQADKALEANEEANED